MTAARPAHTGRADDNDPLVTRSSSIRKRKCGETRIACSATARLSSKVPPRSRESANSCRNRVVSVRLTGLRHAPSRQIADDLALAPFDVPPVEMAARVDQPLTLRRWLVDRVSTVPQSPTGSPAPC
jgi:hypothetical protein